MKWYWWLLMAYVVLQMQNGAFQIFGVAPTGAGAAVTVPPQGTAPALPSASPGLTGALSGHCGCGSEPGPGPVNELAPFIYRGTAIPSSGVEY